jgi:homocitrate synthase NifV
MGDAEVEAIRSVARLELPTDLTAWARATEGDIEAAVACRVPYVHISFAISPVQLELSGKSQDWLLERVETLVTLARRDFDGVSVGALDGTRTGTDFLCAFGQAAVRAGARRMRIADTVGIGNVPRVRELFERLGQAVPELPLEFHGHNDLGLATANTLAAVEGGASAVSVTVNGLGERAGNAPLEEVVIALKVLYAMETSVDVSRLQALCRTVADYSRRPIPGSKPIVGDDVFAHESGIHVAALLKNPYAFQPFLPTDVGASEMRFVVGKHSGSAALRHALEQRGIAVDDTTLRKLIPHVRQAAEDKKEALTGQELEELYRLAIERDFVFP